MDFKKVELAICSFYLVRRKSALGGNRIRSDFFENEKMASAWQLALSGAPLYELGFSETDLAMLGGMAESSEEIKKYESALFRRWKKKKLEAELKRSLALMDEMEPDAIAANLEKNISEIGAGGVEDARTHGQIGADLVRGWAERLAGQESRAMRAPQEPLRRAIGGWARGKLYLVGAVTSGHKTTFLRQALFQASKDGFSALFWSCEDGAEDVAARTIAAEVRQASTRTFLENERPTGATDDDLRNLIRETSQHLAGEASQRFRIIEDSLPNLSHVCNRLKYEKTRGVDVFGLDFLQLVQPDNGRTPDAVHFFHVSTVLAGLAKSLDIAILATVQPTQLATREHQINKTPLTLGDLRGGSAIAQAAYGVILLNKVWTEEGEQDRRFIDLDVAKWKNGETGVIRMAVQRSNDLILQQ